MINTILKIVDIILFASFFYVGLKLVERIEGSKHYSSFLFIAISLFFAVLESAIFSLPTCIVYITACLLLYISVRLLFKVSAFNSVYSTLAILMCGMCVRGIGASILALSFGFSVYHVFNNDQLTLICNCFADLVCFVALLIVASRVSDEEIRLSLRPCSEKGFFVSWTIGSAALMILNSILFEFYAAGRIFAILELCYCISVLVAGYAMLFFTLRFNKDASATQNLSSELLAQSRLQSALMRDALFVAQADITTNKIIDGLGVYSENLSADTITYDQWLEFARAKVHPEDYGHFYKAINRQNLFDCFELGTEPDPFMYRRFCDDGVYRWVKVSIRLYNDTTTNDVHIVGYALDVDADMREKEELEKRAQTDSLTKLLNRETAEKAIAQEIEKGCGALFLMDIDDFKDVNDCMGHETGDKVLITAAKRLQKFFGDGNIVGRLGGDEFLAYLKNINDPGALSDKAEKLLDFLCQPPEAPDEPTISFSLGVAPVNKTGLSFTTVYSQADSSLYEKKFNGKRGFLIHEEGK